MGCRVLKIFGFFLIGFCFASQAFAGGNINKSSGSSRALYDKAIKKEIADLSKLKSEIIKQQNRLKELIEEYKKAKADMQETITQVKNKNYKMVGFIYGNADPQVSAKSLSLMPVKDAAKILSEMPGRKAGKILSVMKPSYASKITQMMIKLGIKSVN